MKRSSSAAVSSLPIPDDLRALFARRPIVSGESPELYDALLSRVASEARPEDTTEWFLIKDVVDLTWEIQRLRRFQATLIRDSIEKQLVEYMNTPSKRALLKLLAHRMQYPNEVRATKPPADAGSLPTDGGSHKSEIFELAARKYFAGDRSTKRTVNDLLTREHIGVDIDLMTTRAFEEKLATLDVTAKMAASAEARREDVLRLIRDHRTSFGARTRRALDLENVSDIVPERTTKQLVTAVGSGS